VKLTLNPPRDNPFATRATRPGSIAFRFPEGMDAVQLVARLREHRWWGQIAGPHGCGKSTLLHALREPLETAGRRLVWEALHDNQRRLPARLRDSGAWDASTQVIVDGYEQLSWLSRMSLRWDCRRRGAGLLVTCHRPLHFPLLISLRTDLQAAQQLVRQLQGEGCRVVTPEDVAERFGAHEGNIREMLFDLYDLYEARREPVRSDR